MLVFIIKLYYLWTSYMSIMMLWDIHKFFIFLNFTKVAIFIYFFAFKKLIFHWKEKKKKKSMFFHCKTFRHQKKKKKLWYSLLDYNISSIFFLPLMQAARSIKLTLHQFLFKGDFCIQRYLKRVLLSHYLPFPFTTIQLSKVVVNEFHISFFVYKFFIV
jgi:hypothetical protein